MLECVWSVASVGGCIGCVRVLEYVLVLCACGCTWGVCWGVCKVCWRVWGVWEVCMGVWGVYKNCSTSLACVRAGVRGVYVEVCVGSMGSVGGCMRCLRVLQYSLAYVCAVYVGCMLKCV